MKNKKTVKVKLECGHSITMDEQHARECRRIKFRCYRCVKTGSAQDRRMLASSNFRVHA